MKRTMHIPTHTPGALILAVILLLPTGLPAAPLTDTTVADQVEDELIMDPAVPASQIDVSSREGIVTLEGTVDNLLAKTRAVNVAETVKGVRGVVNTLQVTPSPARSDGAIEKDVRQALLDDPATESYEVAVAVEDNVVTLTGEVDSWQEKQLCDKVASGVQGVTGVNNRIAVTTEVSRPDDEIKAGIERTLHWDALVDDALIEVRVNDGNVTLSGTVGSAAEKSQAVNDAYMAGVKSVSAEDLEVRMWARKPELRGDKYEDKSDADIREAVEDALAADPRVMAGTVDPEVENRVVTLRGTVDNLKAKRAASRDARNTVGVWAVENRLKVRPDYAGGDEALSERIKHVLERDPYVESDEITVDATNGVVYLYGMVPTHYEKAHAEDLTARLGGVVAVENRLVVMEAPKPYASDPYVDEWRMTDYEWYRIPPLATATGDAAIQEEIERELFWSPFVEADQVEVAVENGVAILSGTVDSWSEYNAATANAQESGAVDVENNMVVE